MAVIEMPGFCCRRLEDGHAFYEGRLPEKLVIAGEAFEELWGMHPEEYQRIRIHGRWVRTPRWQQAYGADYHYTGQVNRALPVPPLVQPLLDWAREVVDGRLNGVLLNWYDGGLGHYMGKHRDSTVHMLPDAPIVTISLGAERTFRLRPWKGSGRLDFAAPPGAVFVMPYDTNLAWTHEVPKSANCRGRRISVSIRGFGGGAERRATQTSPPS